MSDPRAFVQYANVIDGLKKLYRAGGRESVEADVRRNGTRTLTTLAKGAGMREWHLASSEQIITFLVDHTATLVDNPPQPVVRERTVWVKSTSHRSRERLYATCKRAGLDQPQPWFRTDPSRKSFRLSGEYFELPESLDVSGIKGITTLKYAVPAYQRFKPISF